MYQFREMPGNYLAMSTLHNTLLVQVSKSPVSRIYMIAILPSYKLHLTKSCHSTFLGYLFAYTFHVDMLRGELLWGKRPYHTKY